jgi:hypothetical protein
MSCRLNFMISLKVLSLQNNIFSRFIPEALFWETSMNGAYSYFTRVSHLCNNFVHVNINSSIFAFSRQLILGDNDFSLALWRDALFLRTDSHIYLLLPGSSRMAMAKNKRGQHWLWIEDKAYRVSMRGMEYIIISSVYKVDTLLQIQLKPDTWWKEDMEHLLTWTKKRTKCHNFYTNCTVK